MNYLPNKYDPYRPVNWRWERARWLREHGKNSRKNVDDEWTRLAKRFQAEKEKHSGPTAENRLINRYPGVYYAHKIRSYDDDPIRWAIEARLLAREPFERIAYRSNTDISVIKSYEALFFNVLDCLDKPDYIVNVVFGDAVHRGLNERQYDLLWKMYGYAGGYFVLDTLINPFNISIMPTSRDGVDAFIAEDMRASVRRKAAWTARTLPSAYNQQLILDTYTRFLEIERNAADTGDTQSAITKNLAATVQLFRFQIGNEQRMDIPQLDHYDNLGTELRADEMLSIGVKGDTPEFRKAVTLSFPELKDGSN